MQKSMPAVFVPHDLDLWPWPLTFWPHNNWVSRTHGVTFLWWSYLHQFLSISWLKNRQTDRHTNATENTTPTTTIGMSYNVIRSNDSRTAYDQYITDTIWQDAVKIDLSSFELQMVDKPRRRKDTLVCVHRLWMNINTMFGLRQKSWRTIWK